MFMFCQIKSTYFDQYIIRMCDTYSDAVTWYIL